MSFYHLCAFYYFRLIYIRKPEHLSHNGHADLFLSLSKVEILTLTAFTIVLVLTMDKICTISDESDTSGDQEDTEHVKVNQGATVSRSEHFLRVQQPSRGESVSRLGPVGNVQTRSPASFTLYPGRTNTKSKTCHLVL